MSAGSAAKKSKTTSVHAIPMAAALGAEVKCGDVRDLTDEDFQLIHRAALDHLVILIRGQTLTDPELIALGRRFGALDSAACEDRQREGAHA